VRGPGIGKANTKILDDPAAVLHFGKKIEEMMSQTDDGWNPHARLEFLFVWPSPGKLSIKKSLKQGKNIT